MDGRGEVVTTTPGRIPGIEGFLLFSFICSFMEQILYPFFREPRHTT